MTTKTCKECKKELERTEENFYTARRGGWTSRCRSCHNRYMCDLGKLRRATGQKDPTPRLPLQHNKRAHQMYQRARFSKHDSVITKEWIRERLVVGVCEATGIKFDFGPGAWKPFQPSVDRIDSSKDYTPDNCQVVVLIHNFARGKWGDAALIEYVKALVKKVRNKI